VTARIVVVADTHMPRRARELPRPLLEAMAGADAIIHLGDVTSSSVLHALHALAPVYAVHGNNDEPEVVASLPSTCRVEIGGKTLVLLHGHLGGATAMQAAKKVTGGDAVLFGHSHRAYCQFEEGRLMFNPGSPTDRRWAEHRSFGIIDVADELRGTIVNLW
jgi:putative phosphoesterase